MTGERDPALTLRISPDPSARLSHPSGESAELLVGGRRFVFAEATAGVRNALAMLAAGGGSADALRDLVVEDGVAALARWHHYLHSLAAAGAVRYALSLGKTPLARLSGAPLCDDVGAVTPPGKRYLLSRFTYARRNGAALVLETSRSCGCVEILDPRAGAIVAAIAKPSTLDDLASAVPEVSPAAASAFLALLEAAGMLVAGDAPQDGADDDASGPARWEFGDSVFHSWSRWGLNARASGATFKHQGHLKPLPAVKPPMSDRRIALYRPDLDALAASDPPLTHVLEARRSIRAYGARPITARALGEFLYRVARVRGTTPPDGNELLHEISSRPYPSGGACYPLELYPVIERCDGLDRGLYHYDPLHHRLESLDAPLAELESLLADASHGAACESSQVLIVITARFGRVNWKYEAIAYALVLKEVGVLYQSMYLVATAMGLAPCALGCGDSDRWRRATGAPTEEESSVGEFLLGSAAAPV